MSPLESWWRAQYRRRLIELGVPTDLADADAAAADFDASQDPEDAAESEYAVLCEEGEPE